MEREDRIKLCRIVGVLLLSDGKLFDDEVEHMRRLMERLELDHEAREEVMDRLEASTEVMDDVRTLRAHGQRLLDELQEASRTDGIIAPAEVDLIKMIARVLRGSDAPLT